MAEHRLVKETLIEPIKKLLKSMQIAGVTTAGDPLQAFIALDGVENLNLGSMDYPTILCAFRRIMHILQVHRLPIWAFLFTTQWPLHSIAPSTRINHAIFERIPPFVSFMTDIALLTQSPEMIKTRPLTQFATLNHLSALGRPL